MKFCPLKIWHYTVFTILCGLISSLLPDKAMYIHESHSRPFQSGNEYAQVQLVCTDTVESGA